MFPYCDRTITENKLKFLIDDYGMSYTYLWEGGQVSYIFENSYGKLIFWHIHQFGEYGFLIEEKNKPKKYTDILDVYNLQPEIFEAFQKKHKGLKWFFKDDSEDRWDMIASIIRLEINVKGSFFGLKILKP